MQWSKLRSRMREFLAPDVRKRVDFHLTTYRKLSELASEFWVTIDGERIFSASTTRNDIATYVLTRTTGLLNYGDGPEPRMVEVALSRREVHAPVDVTSSIRTYFDLDPRIALAWSDPILKALAMLSGLRSLQTTNARWFGLSMHCAWNALIGARGSSPHCPDRYWASK